MEDCAFRSVAVNSLGNSPEKSVPDLRPSNPGCNGDICKKIHQAMNGNRRWNYVSLPLTKANKESIGKNIPIILLVFHNLIVFFL